MCKVQWSHHGEDEATWEREEELHIDFPHLFTIPCEWHILNNKIYSNKLGIMLRFPFLCASCDNIKKSYEKKYINTQRGI